MSLLQKAAAMTRPMCDDELKAHVLNSLANARENGFNIDSWTPEALTADLMDIDGDISNMVAASDDNGDALAGKIAAIIRETRA
jgi:hypothetical protein